eukprot:2254468-Pleurochrysis_carterae.AAC.2
MLPARRMKSLFSSLLMVAVTIRRRYCTFLSAALAINSGPGHSGTSSSVIGAAWPHLRLNMLIRSLIPNGDGKLTRATEIIMAKTARTGMPARAA